VRSARRKRSDKSKLYQNIDIHSTESTNTRGGSSPYKEFDFRRRIETVYQTPGVLTRSVRSVQWFMQYSGLQRRSSRDLDGLLPNPCAEQDDFTTLVVGCSTMDTMEFHSECTSADVVSGIVRTHKGGLIFLNITEEGKFPLRLQTLYIILESTNTCLFSVMVPTWSKYV
jgi:hypothetical protein